MYLERLECWLDRFSRSSSSDRNRSIRSCFSVSCCCRSDSRPTPCEEDCSTISCWCWKCMASTSTPWLACNSSSCFSSREYRSSSPSNRSLASCSSEREAFNIFLRSAISNEYLSSTFFNSCSCCLAPRPVRRAFSCECLCSSSDCSCCSCELQLELFSCGVCVCVCVCVECVFEGLTGSVAVWFITKGLKKRGL